MRACFLLTAMLPSFPSMQVKDLQEHLVSSSHPDFAQVKAELMKLKGTKIDEATAGLIRGLLNNLNKTTFEALYDDRDIAQAMIDNAYNAVVTCNNEREAAFGDQDTETIWNAEVLVNETRENHTECKNHHEEGQTPLHNVMNQTCTRHNNKVKHYKNCHTTSATEDSDDVYNWMRCLENFTNHHCDEYEIGREQCENATEEHEEAERDCHTKQNIFENAVCSLDAAISSACSHYEGCYDSAHASWVTTKATVEEMEILFKAQMQALEQLLCFGNGIIANYTDYDHCEFDTCFECPNMNITYLEPPPKIECDEALPHKPCDEAWITAEYGQWSNTSADLLAACQACPTTNGNGGNNGNNGGGLDWSPLEDGTQCGVGSAYIGRASLFTTEAALKAECEAEPKCMAVEINVVSSKTYLYETCNKAADSGSQIIAISGGRGGLR